MTAQPERALHWCQDWDVVGEEVPTEPTRFVRVSLHPPPRYTASADLDLRLKRFELYVRQTGIPEDQWAAELLPLLDDAAFQVVLQLGLAESMDFNIITESLKQQFSPKGNELEWQRRLQSRRQQPGNNQENSWCNMLERWWWVLVDLYGPLWL